MKEQSISVGSAVTEVREAVRRFQHGYTARDLSAIDESVVLLVPGADAELVGIGASIRGGTGGPWRFHTIHWSMPVD